MIDSVDFESVFDVGCANGFLLETFHQAGKEIAGIDSSPAVSDVLPSAIEDRVRVADFAQARGVWDLVCCVEVAEHIAPERSQELVQTVAQLARNWVYFTAAPPGQEGRGHINCRPHSEWLDWFSDLGWSADSERTAQLRNELENLGQTPWLRTNSFVLRPMS